MEKTHKSMRIRTEVANSIEAMAIEENRSFSNMVEVLLEKCAKHKHLILSLK